MKLTFDPHGPPWYFRLAALAVAVGLTLCLLYAGVAGVKFVHLLVRVSGEIAESSAQLAAAKSKTPGLAPQTSDDPGVVVVQMLPEKAH